MANQSLQQWTTFSHGEGTLEVAMSHFDYSVGTTVILILRDLAIGRETWSPAKSVNSPAFCTLFGCLV